jgi:hypothetical protein
MESDRPARDDSGQDYWIEITPEMIEAGKRAYSAWEKTDNPYISDLVKPGFARWPCRFPALGEN